MVTTARGGIGTILRLLNVQSEKGVYSFALNSFTEEGLYLLQNLTRHRVREADDMNLGDKITREVNKDS